MDTKDYIRNVLLGIIVGSIILIAIHILLIEDKLTETNVLLERILKHETNK